MPRYENGERFWEIERDGTTIRIRTGRMGEPGEQLVRTAHYEDEAMCDFDERIEEKLVEGYRSVDQPRDELAAISPELIDAVVSALAPERVAAEGGEEALSGAWMVLGDWLSARGDIRGELISVDQALAFADGNGARRLLGRRDNILTKWLPRWLGDYWKLDGPDRPINLAWDHGFVCAARIGTKPGGLDLSRWRLGLRDLVPVLDTVLSSPLMVMVQQLRVAELDPRSRRDLTRALPLLGLAHRPALIRLELGGMSRGRWVRDETGNMTQRESLARIGSLAPLALASHWAPRLAALRIVGRELRVFPPLPQLRVLELQVPVFDEELRQWLLESSWPRLERLWLRAINSSDPWAGSSDLESLLEHLTRSPLRELGLQGRKALESLVWRAVSGPLHLDELRLFGLGEASVDVLLESAEYLDGVERLVLEDTTVSRRWIELKQRFGDRLHRVDETFGVVGERTGNELRESLFDAPGWG